MRKFLTVISSLFLLAGCGGGGGGISLPGGGSSVIGTDLSGTYVLHSFECYTDYTLSTITAQATINPSPSHSFVLSGNNATTTINNGCATTITRELVFNQTTVAPGGTIGNYTGSAGSVSNSGSCSYTLTWNYTLGSATVTPASLSKTYTNGSTSSSSGGLYAMLNSGYLMNEAPEIAVVGAPTDKCFWFYDKQ
jgi:hypothetical protein